MKKKISKRKKVEKKKKKLTKTKEIIKFDRKELAKILFIKNIFTQKEIALQVGCREATLTEWIKKGNWFEIKESETITKQQLLRDSYAQLKALNEAIAKKGGVISKDEADAKAILRKEIEALKDNPLHLYIEMINEFLSFIGKNYPIKLKEIADLSSQFINSKNG